MFNKKIIYIMILVFLFIPKIVVALSNDYKDEVSILTGSKVDNDKINIYLFYGDGCEYCARENEFLNLLEDKYSSYLNIYRFETWNDDNNEQLMNDVKKKLNVSTSGVPFTIIGLKTYVGYNEYTKEKIIENINKYLQKELIESTKDDSDSFEEDNNISNIEQTNDEQKNFVNIPIILIASIFIIIIIIFIIRLIFKYKNKF